MSKDNARTIEVNVKPKEKELIREAAENEGRSMSEFVRQAALRRAEFIMQVHKAALSLAAQATEVRRESGK